MIYTSVKDGTGAGRKRLPIPEDAACAICREDWVCPECGKKHRYFWTSCPVDGTPRPEAD